jgi:hypothetical protein
MTNTLPLSDRALQPGEADLLGRGAFVRNLAIILSNAPKGDSVVFALYGKWGEGKTSTLTLLDAEFAARKANGEASPVVIRFNPWVFSGREHLFNAFFEDIGNAIGTSDVPDPEDTAKKWKRLGAYSQLAGTALGGINAALSIGGIAIPFADMIGDGLKKMGEITGTATDAVGNAHVKSLTELRGEMEETLESLENPLLVVLDDLDRLPPNELVEIFQLLKSTVDLPNVHYLLLCDRSNIERNLKKQGLRPDYLDKIVQFSAPLPPVSRARIEGLLLNQLQKAFAKFATKDARLSEEFWTNITQSSIPKVFSNLRDVKRFLGEIRITLPVFCTSGHFDLNPLNHLQLQVLRLFAPSTVELIRTSKDKLISEVPYMDLMMGTDRKKRDEKTNFVEEDLTNTIPKEKRTILGGLLKDLLTPVSHTYSRKEEAIEQRFLATDFWFESYFTLELPTEIVSVEDVHQIRSLIASSKGTINSVIHPIVTNIGFSPLMRSIKIHFPDATESQVEQLITSMLSSRDIVGEPMLLDQFHESPIHFFSKWLRDKAPLDREKTLLKMLSATGNIRFFSFLLYHRHLQPESSSDIPVLIRPFLTRLGTAVAKAIENRATSGNLMPAEGIGFVQDTWSEWGSVKLLKKWILEQIGSDQDFRSYLSAIGDYSPAWDGRENVVVFRIHYAWLKHFPSLTTGIRRCKQLAESSISSDDQIFWAGALSSFTEAADKRRGPRILPKKLPAFIDGWFHENSIPYYGKGEVAVIPIPPESESNGEYPGDSPVAERLRGELKKIPSIDIVAKVRFGSSDGLTVNTCFMVMGSAAQVLPIAKKFRLPGFFMIYGHVNQTRELVLFGCNGEGQMNLGNPEDRLLTQEHTVEEE